MNIENAKLKNFCRNSLLVADMIAMPIPRRRKPSPRFLWNRMTYMAMTASKAPPTNPLSLFDRIIYCCIPPFLGVRPSGDPIRRAKYQLISFVDASALYKEALSRSKPLLTKSITRSEVA